MGSAGLSLLATHFGGPLLRELALGPHDLAALRPAVGSPPQTTMRGYLRTLVASGAVAKRRHAGFNGSFDYRLTPAGRGLGSVADVLSAWLDAAPMGPLVLGTPEAKAAIRSLCDGWTSGIVDQLVAGPKSLTELAAAMPGFNYPALERRFSNLRSQGMLEIVFAAARGTRYGPSAWLRASVAPLAAAARWERLSLRPADALGDRDVVSTFLLALPMLRIDIGTSGVCSFAAGSGIGGLAQSVATARIQGGEVTATGAPVADPVDAWASGAPPTWLAAVTDGEPERLRKGGEIALVDRLIRSLHEALFGSRPFELGKETLRLASAPTP